MELELVFKVKASDDGTFRLADVVGRIVLDGEPQVSVGPVRPAQHAGADVSPIVAAYERTDPESRTRELLEVLPSKREGGLTPTELSARMKGDLSRGSVRAVIRNLQRTEANMGFPKKTLIDIEFAGYGQEGAGRYFVSDEARRQLDNHLGR